MPAPKRTATKKATAPAVVEETSEDEDVADLEDLDDVSEVEEVAAKPAKKAAKKAPPAAEKPAFGTAELAKHVSEATGKEYDGKAIRVLLRKLSRDGVLDRTVGEDRARYSFTGPKDPQVVKIVKAVKDGALEAEKKAGIEKAKASKAKKDAKAAPPEAEVEEAEDVEDLDAGDDE